MEIKEFTIKKLHGSQDISIKFTDNRLILVGENGTGKTTCMKIFYYFLSNQFNKLLAYDFELIILIVDSQDCIEFSKVEINFLCKSAFNSLNNLPSRIRDRFKKAMRYNDKKHLLLLCNHYNVPFEFLSDEEHSRQLAIFDDESEFNNDKFTSKFKKYKNLISNFSLLYMPTYRRIESSFTEVFGKIDDDRTRFYVDKHINKHVDECNNVEPIAFGMDDVDSTINDSLKIISEFSRKSLEDLTQNYLSEIVEQKYLNNTDFSIESEEIENIKELVNNINNDILSAQSKANLHELLEQNNKNTEIDEYQKILLHYLKKLSSFNKSLKDKKLCIKLFFELCNSYILNLEIKYDSNPYSYSIKSKLTDKEIDLQNLSSGEKQIVSLFCYLYLSSKKKIFIIIDEPELSLSVKWQRRFLLDISKANNCSGFFAVTHSPFIFENELEKYACGINEFTSKLK